MTAINIIKTDIPSFEQIHSKEKDFVDGLVSDYGLDIVKTLWDKMNPLKKQKFVVGEERFSDYETLLRQKSQVYLVAKVKSLNPKTLEKLHSSEAIINHLLLQRSGPALQSLASKEESLSTEYEPLAKSCREYEENIKQNAALIHHFETAYSKEVFQQVYNAIPEQRREKIEKGETSLLSYVDVLRKKCEEKRASSRFGTLPSKEAFTDFFKSSKVVGYTEGAQGVFFVEGLVDGVKQKFVVKASDKPAQETFATELVSHLHIKTPSFHTIDSAKDSDLFKSILKNVEKHPSFVEKYEDEKPKQFTIMAYIPGTTLEDLRGRDLESVLQEAPSLFYDQVLPELGQIAAADFLLYYQDRLPVIGGGNTANIMILKNDKGQHIGAVGIDQVASFTTKQTSLLRKMQDPFKRVQGYVDPIIAKPDKISEAAKEIFKDGLDTTVQEVLDKDRALAAIQKGIVCGLSRIATISTKKLTEIHESVLSSPYTRDQVDLEAHQTMLKTIHSSLYKISSPV